MTIWRRALSSSAVVRSSFKHESPRNTLASIRRLYEAKTPISVVTAHDFITAKWAHQADVDINLVGDSLAMTALGYDDTNEITLDEFLFHVRAVARGNPTSLLIADLPFGSYETSPAQALGAAVRTVKEGRAQGVKLEGGNPEVLPTIAKIVAAGIPVMGHVGLTPQRHHTLSGFKLQGNNVADAVRIHRECLALQAAGVFAIVLECVPNRLAQLVTASLDVPTIGIGAGPHCSGNVLVVADMLGMNAPEGSPKSKFVKEYAQLHDVAVEALKRYKSELRDATYPDEHEHGYKIKKEVLEQVKQAVKNS